MGFFSKTLAGTLLKQFWQNKKHLKNYPTRTNASLQKSGFDICMEAEATFLYSIGRKAIHFDYFLTTLVIKKFYDY